MIPYGCQHIDEDDIAAVVAALTSERITQGPKLDEFEQSIRAYTGADFAVACNSATSSLHVACMALGLGEGDLLWTSPITFVASANCARYCGADVDFVDIDPDTNLMSTEALGEKLEKAERVGKIPDIVVPVHLCGHSCDMREIRKLSEKYGFKVLEDASHAMGARYLDQPVGDCQYSDICVFSFHPVKIITTAEGGVATCNDAELAEKMTRYRSHGITRDPSLMTVQSHGPWYYQQLELGYNYRMNDIQAALGVSQMKKLDPFILMRHRHAERYHRAFAELPVKLPIPPHYTYSSFHLYPIRLRLDQIDIPHRLVFERLQESGIGVNLHYIPVHLQPYYSRLGFRKGSYPNAEAYYDEAISIPIFAQMSEQQSDQVIEAVIDALG